LADERPRREAWPFLFHGTEQLMETHDPKSPCISVCALNEADVCIGCFRSSGEITLWASLSPEQKLEVLHRAKARRKADQTFELK
jgi:predicted Fe-S protein YdhL (DUF1289 family)